MMYLRRSEMWFCVTLCRSTYVPVTSSRQRKHLVSKLPGAGLLLLLAIQLAVPPGHVLTRTHTDHTDTHMRAAL